MVTRGWHIFWRTQCGNYCVGLLPTVTAHATYGTELYEKSIYMCKSNQIRITIRRIKQHYIKPYTRTNLNMAATSVSHARSANTLVSALMYQLPVAVLRNERKPTTATVTATFTVHNRINCHDKNLFELL